MQKKKTLLVLFIFSVFICSTLVNFSENQTITDAGESPDKEKSIEIKTSYFVNEIIITENDDWETLNDTMKWCNGSGTEAYPYIISNVTINLDTEQYGIYISNTDVYFVIRNSTIQHGDISQYGVYIHGDVQNGFLRNNTLNNERNAYDDTIGNNWTHNRYSDYEGYDLNEDGIGETPYKIDGGDQTDDYPLTDRKDTQAPIINLDTPEFQGSESPTFNANISDYMLNQSWYLLRNETTSTDNVSFIGSEIVIEQSLWDQFHNDNITLEVYANDSVNNMGQDITYIYKDLIKPNISIYRPTQGADYAWLPPQFNITVSDDMQIDAVWYTINGQGNYDAQINESVNEQFVNGSIQFEIWENMDEGMHNITFYVQDKAGNIGLTTVIVYKDIPEEGGEEGGQPSLFEDPIGWFIWFITSIITTILGIFGLGIYLKKKEGKDKTKGKCPCIGEEDCWCDTD
jgi:hypothetical protein